MRFEWGKVSLGMAQLYRCVQTWLVRAVQPRLASLQVVVAVSLAVTGTVLGVGHLGGFQSLELRLYDRLVRLQSERGDDPRLLVVAITERDIRALQRQTPSDKDLASVLAKLNAYGPRAIGVDLYRDVPQEPGHAQLLAQLRSPRIVAITKLGNSEETTIPAPAGVPNSQVGFNDLLIDHDGVIRRGLLFGSTETKTYTSFALQLAMLSLKQEGIVASPSGVDPTLMQLGQATFVMLEPDSGAYSTLDAAGYQMLLNYRSPRFGAQTISFTQVLRGELRPEWVRDRIVLIGNTSPSGKDLFYTPYSAGARDDHQMAGVHVHAQMLSQILDAATGERSLLWYWVGWQEGLWIYGWALAAGILAWRVRHPISLLLVTGGVLGLVATAGWLLLTLQGWIPTVAPAIAILMSAGLVVAYRGQRAHRQQQMVMTLLGQNTSPEIAAALWSSRDRLLQSGRLPGQRLTATMLFTDIKDFSSIAEQMPPENLLEWLNEYLEAMTQEIKNHHGIVNKFTGDGLLAVFGVPMPRLELEGIQRDAQHAVACALAMRDRLTQLNEGWAQCSRAPIQMRVGMFTGPVVVGSLGGKDRLEYGVIGDSVNIASRLESCFKERQPQDCRILIAHETWMHLANQFEVEAWGPMELKGKQQMIQVYHVVDRAGGQAAAILRPAVSHLDASTPDL